MSEQKKHIFDNPQNVKRLLRGLYLSCIILFALDFIIHRHTSQVLENIWGFYALYGFVGCVVLVLVAKWMRTFLMRDEQYYTRNEDSGNTELTSGEQNVDE